jgi:phosphohistidine swiveling domain-containing protein
VAREYNIPAVVSVKGAMDLEDGTKIAVDGYSGQVLLVED